MIIKFNPVLLTSADPQVKNAVARIMLEVIEDRFLWDVDNLDEIFLAGDKSFFEEAFANNFFSPYNKDAIYNRIGDIYRLSNYITQIQKFYLTTIAIGFDEGEINPITAYDLITKPSKLILENETNDWNFVCGIVEKYANHKERKSIYRLIQRAIERFWLIAHQAGGKTQIKQIIENHMVNDYSLIWQYKLMALFDSDKIEILKLGEQVRAVLRFFKRREVGEDEDVFYENDDVTLWHMLYKREVENYVPLEILINNIAFTNDEVLYLRQLSAPEYDYLDFESYLAPHKEEISIKSYVPSLFRLDFTRDKLEERCRSRPIQIELPSGTLQEVSEIEQILLKIVKLV